MTSHRPTPKQLDALQLCYELGGLDFFRTDAPPQWAEGVSRRCTPGRFDEKARVEVTHNRCMTLAGHGYLRDRHLPSRDRFTLSQWGSEQYERIVERANR